MPFNSSAKIFAIWLPIGALFGCAVDSNPNPATTSELSDVVDTDDVSYEETLTFVHVDQVPEQVGTVADAEFAAFTFDEADRLTVTATTDAMVAVAVESNEAFLFEATLDGLAVPDDDVMYDVSGTGFDGGVVLALAQGQTFIVDFDGNATIDAAVLAAAPGSTAFEDLLADESSLRIPSWLKSWVRRTAARGVACWVIEEYLESRGMICPDKPWWMPNPYCVWQGMTCGYPAY